MQKLISPHAVARRLGLSTKTVHRMLRRGEINGRKIGGQWRSDPDNLFDAVDLSLSHGGLGQQGTTGDSKGQGAQKPTS